jgi:glutamate N-acetyltransferase / amino-acid N-acetyltransferase
VNAGQANAATGDLGMHDARASQEHLSKLLDCSSGDILVMSTGVIGRRIKLEAMVNALPALVAHLGTDETCANRAAIAITTTGTCRTLRRNACFA